MVLNYGKNVANYPRKSHPKINKPLNDVSSEYKHSKKKKTNYPSEKSLDIKTSHSNLRKSTNLNYETPSSKFHKKSYSLDPESLVKSNIDTMPNLDNPLPLNSIISTKHDLQGDVEDRLGNPLKNLCNYVTDRKFKAESKEFQSAFCHVYEEAQKLENKLKLLYEEYTRVQKLNKYLSFSQKHKEDMLGNSQEENRK